MSYWLGCILFYLLFLQDASHGIRLVEVRIPNYVIKGSTAQLECLYDLDGEALYSVKWYKDGNEFYRYVPRDMPPAQTFLLPGVSVDLHNSSDAIVTLRSVNLQSAGRFRCEVSGEAPSFQTVTEQGDMIVVSLPDQGPPKISGGRPRYQIGDWVRINCTAGRSKPSVQLTWFVNGEPAEPHMLRKYDTIVSGREGLETSVLGLQFRVDQHHFRNGDMKLKCVASLSTFYWRSNEESVEGDRPQKAPVLESRETVYASNSRADPVQASRTDSVVVANAPGLLMLLLPVAIVVCGCLEQLHFMQHLFVRQILSQRQQQQPQQKQKQQQQQLVQRQHDRRQQQQQDERIEQQRLTKPAAVVVASPGSSSPSTLTASSSSSTPTAAVASSPLPPMFGNERRLQPAPQLTRVSAANMSSSTSSSSAASLSTSLLPTSSSSPSPSSLLSSPPSPSSLLLSSSSSSSPSSLLSLSLCALLLSSLSSTSSQAATRQGALGAR